MTPSEIKKWIFWFSSALLRLEEGHDGGSIGGSRDFSGIEVLVFQPEGAQRMPWLVVVALLNKSRRRQCR